MPIAQADIVVDASPAEVMAVLVDYESYPDFLPNIRSVEVLELGPGQWRVSYVIRIIRDLPYTLHLVRDEHKADRNVAYSHLLLVLLRRVLNAVSKDLRYRRAIA